MSHRVTLMIREALGLVVKMLQNRGGIRRALHSYDIASAPSRHIPVVCYLLVRLTRNMGK